MSKNSSSSLEIYFEALERLEQGRPEIVPAGSIISKDTVAMEAGRGRGAIKKSRPRFEALIEAIAKARTAQVSAEAVASSVQRKGPVVDYRAEYHKALNREIILLDKVAELEKKLATSNRVSVLRK